MLCYIMLCLSCAASWLLLLLFLFKVVPVPDDKISFPLYESESCESLLQVEWQPDLSPQQNIFSLDYGMQADFMVSSCILAGIYCVVPW